MKGKKLLKLRTQFAPATSGSLDSLTDSSKRIMTGDGAGPAPLSSSTSALTAELLPDGKYSSAKAVSTAQKLSILYNLGYTDKLNVSCRFPLRLSLPTARQL